MSDIVTEADVKAASAWHTFISGQDDEHWDWASIAASHPAGDHFSSFALHANGELHGLAFLENGYDLRLTQEGGCLELDYMAAAPGDRRTAAGLGWTQQRVTPVGKVMLLCSINESCRKGHSGALCWHAEPGAEEWYETEFPGIRLLRDDRDGDRLLTYYEISPGQAEAYCRKHGTDLGFKVF